MRKFAVACVTTLGLALPATAGAATTVTREHSVIPIATQVLNPCSGETVTITGQDVVDVVSTDNGTRSRIAVTDRSVGEGVSESGARYRFDDTYSSTTVFQIGRPGGSLFTHLTRMKHVGGGPKATDFTLMTGTLVAWDGAGNTLADRSFVRTRCR